jgi:hypothetical protein
MDRKRKEYDLYRKTRQASAIKWLVQDKDKAFSLKAQIEEVSKKFEFYRGINKAMTGR